ncbi:MAG: HlyD family efflux transporter periplasmic adaptor subunit [Pseudomonadota bacterium]
MRFLRRSLAGLFLLAATLGLLGYAGQSFYAALQERWTQQTQQRPARERVFTVNVVKIEPRSIAPVLTTFGEVISRRSLEVRAPVGGTVVELADGFEDGGTVEAGQVLVRIDPRDAQSALDVVETDVEEAAAELREAERALVLARDERAASEVQMRLRAQALQRQRDLLARGVVTEAAVEAAELSAALADQSVVSQRRAVAQAEARVDQAKTALARWRINLAEARRRLEETTVRAEFSGVLSEVATLQGGLVANNERLARLIDPEALDVAFRLSNGQYVRLLRHAGQLPDLPVEVVLDVDEMELNARGRISRVSASVGEGQTGRLLFARLDTALGLRPGDFVTVRVIEPEIDDVALLPASALDAENTLLMLGAEDRLEVAQVELLRRQGDDVVVRAGALAGRETVAERSPLLGAGIKVRPLRLPADEEAPLASDSGMVELDEVRRQELIALVKGNTRMPEDVKERILAQLNQPRVPAGMINRIESRMGG